MELILNLDMNKIFIYAKHPIMYQVPIFKELYKIDKDIMVGFGSDISLREVYFKEINSSFKPDTPGLISGFPNIIFKNYGSEKILFFTRFNPGLLFHIIFNKYNSILIHGHDSIMCLLILLIAKFRGVKTIWRGEIISKKRNRLIKYLIKIYLKQFDALLYSCQGNLSFLNSLGFYPLEHNFIKCSVDNSYFKSFNSKNFIKCNEKGILNICFSARFIQRKRPMDLVLAAEKLCIPFHIHWIGDGPLRLEIENETKIRNLKSTFYGFVNQSQISQIYMSCDLGVCCSDYDPSPKVINEMMNFDIISIMTNMVGTSKDLAFMEDDIIDVGDINSIQNRINYYYLNLNKLKIDIKTFCAKKLCDYSPNQNAKVISELI